MAKFYYSYSKSRKAIVCLLVCCLLKMTVQAQIGMNIIVNGNAENASGIGPNWVDASTTDFGNATGTDGGIWYLTNTSSYPLSSPMRSHGGTQFFNAGINLVSETETRTLTQIIDVTALSTQDITYAFDGWVATNGTFAGVPNVVEVKVEFWDNPTDENNLYPPIDIVYEPVSSSFKGWANITGSQDVLAADGVTAIRITLTAQNANTTIQAFFDDLSLTPSLTVLPVSLLNFHAVQTPDHTVALQWQTAQEQNSKYTEVLRSANGKDYQPIGQVAAAGNSSVTKDYSFTDKAPLTGRGFYRLKMVDLDGSFKYSKILQVTTGITGSAIKVFGNPFHDQLNLKIPATTPEKLVLTLLDPTGKTCLRQNVSTRTGDNFVSLYPSGLTAGVYFLHIQGAQTNQTIRVLKQ